MTPHELRRENLEHFLGHATLAELGEVLDAMARELIARGQPGARNLIDTVRMLDRVSLDHRLSSRLGARALPSPIYCGDCTTRPE